MIYNLVDLCIEVKPKKDQMYLMLSGLDKVDFGNKDMTECLLGAQIGAGASSLATDDQTYCVGWQKTIRN